MMMTATSTAQSITTDHHQNSFSGIEEEEEGRVEEEEDVPTIVLSPEQAIVDLEWIQDTEHYSSRSGRSSDDQTTVHYKNELRRERLYTVDSDDVDSDSESFPAIKCQGNIHKSATTTKRSKPKRAAFISATVLKKDQEQRLGMGLQKVDGRLQISSLKEQGFLLSDSPLKVGDMLLSINTQSCAHLTKTEVASLLKSSTGALTIVAENPTGDPSKTECMVTKASKDTKTGLNIASSSRSDRVRVARIDPTSIFRSSLLGKKDRILSINGEDTEFLDVTAAADLIVQAECNVTIVAERQPENPVVVAL